LEQTENTGIEERVKTRGSSVQKTLHHRPDHAKLSRSEATLHHSPGFTSRAAAPRRQLFPNPAPNPIIGTPLPSALPEQPMFDAIARFFSGPEVTLADNDPRLAVAVLLVHLAAVDGTVKDEERLTVRRALQDHFGLDEDTVRKLVHEARRRDAEAVDFYRFTSALTHLDEQQRIEIIRMMWQVVYADKQNHELEDNMVWRIAELIGVSSRQRTILRNQMAKA
jgi:uncharacterized tellurite resistance protein B-like protein